MDQTDDRRRRLKATLAAVLDRAAAELRDFGEDIFEHAELGFREERTAPNGMPPADRLTRRQKRAR